MAINSYAPPSRESPISKLADLVATGLNIAQGVQGYKLNTEKLDQLRKEKDQAQAQEQALSDPNSQESVLLKSALQSSGQKVGDNISGKQIQTVFGDTARQYPLLAFKEKADTDRRIAEIKAQGKEQRLAANSKNKEPSQDQSRAGLFVNRAEKAEQDLNDLMKKGYDPTTVGGSLGRTKYLPEALRGEDAKKFNQALKNFVTAVMRPESGATITPQELQVASEIYFPQPGDTAAVLEQKAETRRREIAGLRAEAGVAGTRVAQAMEQTPVNFAAPQTSKRNMSLISTAQAGGEIPQVRVVGNSTFIKQGNQWVEQ